MSGEGSYIATTVQMFSWHVGTKEGAFEYDQGKPLAPITGEAEVQAQTLKALESSSVEVEDYGWRLR